MWLKTLKVKFQKYNVDVLVYLSDTNENGKEVVKLQSMVNEYYLVEKVEFSTEMLHTISLSITQCQWQERSLKEQPMKVAQSNCITPYKHYNDETC